MLSNQQRLCRRYGAALTTLTKPVSSNDQPRSFLFPSLRIESLSRRRSGPLLMHGVAVPPSATGGIVQRWRGQDWEGDEFGDHTPCPNVKLSGF
jgi:hypothetical protein